MGRLVDCHVHTQRCGHAVGTVAEYVDTASAAGLAGIVVSDHLPLPDELDPDRHLSMPSLEMPAYLREVADARDRHPELTVVTGIEADYLPDRIEETRARLFSLREGANGVSVVLGSVHFLGDWAFDDPACIAEWDRRSVDAVWREYFAVWRDAARSGLFDVMTHPDLVKKFGHRPSFDPSELYAEAAEAAAAAAVVIEVSTAGLRKPVAEIYPAAALLRAFREAGVEATIGSDAHAPSEVGFGLQSALDALAEAGYDHFVFPRSATDREVIEL